MRPGAFSDPDTPVHRAELLRGGYDSVARTAVFDDEGFSCAIFPSSYLLGRQ
jgi:hypothetical protein